MLETMTSPDTTDPGDRPGRRRPPGVLIDGKPIGRYFRTRQPSPGEPMPAITDDFPDHHADCQFRRGQLECNCHELRRLPRLSDAFGEDNDSPTVIDAQPHWLAEVDAIARDTDTGQGASEVVAGRIRDLLIQQTQQAYAAGRTDARPAREQIRAAITNAYYDTRNSGGTMETAADAAADAVLGLLLPGTLAYAEQVAAAAGDLEHETEEETR